MFEQEHIAQLLDILGNRNRRRIIELLRYKPCFVTEISDRLLLNPKAVIEHLALMQKEDVVSFYQDEKRRKYYYLIQDFRLSVEMQPKDEPAEAVSVVPDETEDAEQALPLIDKIVQIRSLLDAREKLIEHLEAVESDIDNKMEEIMEGGRDVLNNNIEAEILISLIYAPLTPIEIADSIGRSIPDVTAALRSLISQGYLETNSGRYSLVVPKKQAVKAQ
ncbi:MAG TPA: ArsR family transcriptional regulator [Methanocorpusculum sp.]|nr:ArsR family transcriptional regulator [Methanocorpusculum parvum]HJJ67006.1 ArsR family transcriptional regulator [Methanocorpusculum sp.]HJJ69379.1 ArsR family transcriptional regulator [Methanocorpusculum sp.]HJJ71619.1 ArsR family transcriptional regulator [Methanocorpusculum sp.]HJJ74726.1 ArsR family transcriptional regulator [Methanocorpusculum sp.]